jgi:putative salt-induced outer membrane protein YdiY
MQYLQNFDHFPFAAPWLALFLVCAMGGVVSAQNVILHLNSGDQISGLIISENTNQVVISNAWVKALSVPLSEISKRETEKNAQTPSPAPSIAGQPAASSATPPPQNKVVAAAPSVARPPAKPKGKWAGEARIGFNAILGTTDSQNFFGHLKLTYGLPYESDPKKFYRNTSQLDGEYQRTGNAESANHVGASDRSDFDIGKKSYGFGLLGAGYDDVQKIDFRYQVGPGVGRHLIQHKNFVMNVESSLDYETAYRRDTSDLETFYIRLADDITWIIRKNLTLTENLAFYADMEHPGQYRGDFTSNLSYGFWKNLTLNLTGIDHYNTENAPGTDENLLEIRTSLGVTF